LIGGNIPRFFFFFDVAEVAIIHQTV
jgi:hypothetical protein